jgi:hypothetical protein
MYITEAAFEPRPAGFTFYPITDATDIESACELRVTFQPTAYYPAERDTGMGADFDARIARIEIRDAAECYNDKAWHILEPREAALAKTFLETHCAAAMWAEAEIEAAIAFGHLDRWDAACTWVA